MKDWDTSSSRARLVRALLDDADRAPDGWLPWDAALQRAFGDRDELLLALFRRWHTTLLARLDAVLEETGGGDLAAVLEVHAGLAADLPGLAAILDAHRQTPALAAAFRRHHQLVALAAGCDMEDATRSLSALVRPSAGPRRRLATPGPCPTCAGLRRLLRRSVPSARTTRDAVTAGSPAGTGLR